MKKCSRGAEESFLTIRPRYHPRKAETRAITKLRVTRREEVSAESTPLCSLGLGCNYGYLTLAFIGFAVKYAHAICLPERLPERTGDNNFSVNDIINDTSFNKWLRFKFIINMARYSSCAAFINLPCVLSQRKYSNYTIDHDVVYYDSLTAAIYADHDFHETLNGIRASEKDDGRPFLITPFMVGFVSVDLVILGLDIYQIIVFRLGRGDYSAPVQEDETGNPVQQARPSELSELPADCVCEDCQTAIAQLRKCEMKGCLRPRGSQRPSVEMEERQGEGAPLVSFRK